ncbi:hypothetical protein TSUD_55290 [Trifolium subterraneum]|uniref:FBD domain-containing protein n=1 Tax=Trifolium subterraneum TaxID=3900 RepID=A0A2Z6MUE9_TRISU|nr:hypothetical protein TSUD_55290 [Trifolium subterraneum]
MGSNGVTIDDSTAETSVGERDMISTLHESILGLILSFVPIVDAVSTSVLSRRWIEVWSSLSTLKLDDSLLFYGKKMQKEQFINFVEKVLLQFTNSSIQIFSLCLTSHQYDASQISEWISFILERRVEKLHIQYADKLFLSSNSLFRCNSLIELTLQMRCTLSLPISVRLTNLQKLNISGIKFVSDSFTYSKDITLSFPILKVFEARGCEWSIMQNISLQVPLLETFSIAIWNRHSNESCKYGTIKVYSQRLTDFSYEGDLEQDIVLYGSTLIRNASIVIVIDEDKEDKVEKLGFQAYNLIRQMEEVKRLKLLFYKGVADLHKDVLASAMVPHCFLSSFKVFQFKGFNANEDDLCLVKFMLANAETLEKMTIYPAFWLRYSDIDIGKVKEHILSLPKCSSFCVVEFSDIDNS